ncbi:MAG: tRNA (adenosine(37)-N6)-threonylcarbamoyltransferase complex transferase subunit TsaD [Bacteroidetes bacterium HGW-Bacteroidetes-6]|jgi:N6-L-threonylcarbamoyladenine synthase|nr:MAG: tRNA (adenosine(37)-N6)-threonylcarbamoyltransferase complex transferase subunit TsaD [Bacteroidetes bacterium HGW-Bacteroidetes-6]
MDVYILGIESSCDDTSAAVLRNNVMLSNVIAGQKVHEQFGGVVPELASRAHQQNIIPVVETAIRNANIDKKQLSGVAFTRGPGLLGSLMVGISFAKSFAWALNIPLIEVDHMHAHIMANFLFEPGEDRKLPEYPFLCLIVSGGHTQLAVVNDAFNMEIIGSTIDDAAGETFDKAAKIMSLPYPGGPMIDKLGKVGNPDAFSFAKPRISGLNFSFSGLKTSILYFLRDELKKDEKFIEAHTADLCASIQKTIVDILVEKTEKAILQTGIRTLALAGGVSANSALRSAMQQLAGKHNLDLHIPKMSLTTDNAAMIAMSGYFKFQKGLFADLSAAPYATGSKR